MNIASPDRPRLRAATRARPLIVLLVLVTATVIVLGCASSARAEPPHDTLAEIKRLESEIRALQRAARTQEDAAGRQQGNEDALPLARRLLELRPDSDSHWILTSTLLSAHQYAEAADAAETWLAAWPESWMARWYLGRAYSYGNRHDRAVPVLREALRWTETGDDRRRVARSLGSLYERQDRFSDALAVYEEVQDLESIERIKALQAILESSEDREPGCLPYPSDTDATDPTENLEQEVRTLIRAARELRDRDAKTKAYEAAIDPAEKLLMRRRDAEAHELKVTVLLGARRYRSAEWAAEDWISQGPPHWLAYFDLGQALTAQERYEKALAPLEAARLLAHGDDRRRVGRQLGFALEKLKRYDEAITVYSEDGDTVSRERVEANRCILEGSQDPLPGCEPLDEHALREEAEKLEAELRALEGSPPAR